MKHHQVLQIPHPVINLLIHLEMKALTVQVLNQNQKWTIYLELMVNLVDLEEN